MKGATVVGDVVSGRVAASVSGDRLLGDAASRTSAQRQRPWSIMPSDTDIAHKTCIRNRALLLRSAQCGCFCCFAIYAPTEIREWTDGEQTALCPRCGIDSMLGSASGWPIEREFLAKMYRAWFGTC